MPGRSGKTFAQAGCASICHAVDENKTIITSQKAANECSECHKNSSSKPADFTHKLSGSCDTCHIDRSSSTAADMVAPVGASYDIWHWKAGRAGNIGFADDQSTLDGKKRSNDGSPGLDKDNANQAKTVPKYIWALNQEKTDSVGTYKDTIKESVIDQMVELSADGKTLKDTDIAVPDGTTVRKKILNDKTGHADNKQISSTHYYTDGKYRVVLTRRLSTGDAKDYAFKFNEDNFFGVAVTSNSAINHAGRSLVKLVFSAAAKPHAQFFSDVKSSHWAYAHINHLAGLGVVNGFPGDTFKPDNSITRGEFAKMIVLALNETANPGPGDNFTDTGKHWSASYVDKAVDLGVVKGYPGGQFRPDNKISRTEAVIMVVRAFRIKSSGKSIQFADIKADHHTYAEIAAARESNLISGYPGNLFKPSVYTTRAEAAKITSLAIQK